MSNLFTKANRPSLLSLLASAALLLGLASAASAQQQQPPPRPPKKKLQASSNFAQYAGRDASNRLIAGGATRNAGVTDEAGAQSLKGQEAYEAGRYDESVAAFKRVTELKPGDAKAFYHLGVAYEAAGRNREAVEAYKRAIALTDRAEIKALSYYNMGNVFAADKQLAQAVEAYKQVIALVPEEAVAHYNLGLAYLALDDRAGAQAEIKTLQGLKSPLAAKLKSLSN